MTPKNISRDWRLSCSNSDFRRNSGILYPSIWPRLKCGLISLWSDFTTGLSVFEPMSSATMLWWNSKQLDKVKILSHNWLNPSKWSRNCSQKQRSVDRSKGSQMEICRVSYCPGTPHENAPVLLICDYYDFSPCPGMRSDINWPETSRTYH